MAERKPVLEWTDSKLGESAWVMSRAYVGSAQSQFEINAHGPNSEGAFRWSAYWGPGGTAPTLIAAQLAAEAVSLAWLNASVVAFGGRVLTAIEWPVVARVLAKTDELHNLPTLADLAREIEGGGHG